MTVLYMVLYWVFVWLQDRWYTGCLYGCRTAILGICMLAGHVAILGICMAAGHGDILGVCMVTGHGAILGVCMIVGHGTMLYGCLYACRTWCYTGCLYGCRAWYGAILGVCMVAGHGTVLIYCYTRCLYGYRAWCYAGCLYGCKNMVPYWVFVWLQDMVLYSVFAFLYLVGTSLVASAFDFYQKMKTNVSSQTVHQLVIVVVRVACALQDRSKQWWHHFLRKRCIFSSLKGIFGMDMHHCMQCWEFSFQDSCASRTIYSLKTKTKSRLSLDIVWDSAFTLGRSRVDVSHS